MCAARIYVDADACPVKAEVYKVAARYKLSVTVVANTSMFVPERPDVELVVVSGRQDAADDWIAEHAEAGDIVITADIPLAGRAVERGAYVLTPRGRKLDEDSICDVLATRNFLEELRSADVVTGGPAPFLPKDRSRFLSALDEVVHASRRAR